MRTKELVTLSKHSRNQAPSAISPATLPLKTSLGHSASLRATWIITRLLYDPVYLSFFCPCHGFILPEPRVYAKLVTSTS